MKAVIDRFFVAELQEQGFDVDYKKLTAIYRASRKKREQHVIGQNKSDSQKGQHESTHYENGSVEFEGR